MDFFSVWCLHLQLANNVIEMPKNSVNGIAPFVFHCSISQAEMINIDSQLSDLRKCTNVRHYFFTKGRENLTYRVLSFVAE